MRVRLLWAVVYQPVIMHAQADQYRAVRVEPLELRKGRQET